MQKSGLPFRQQKAGALEYLGSILHSKVRMLAFQYTFIIVGVVALVALIPATPPSSFNYLKGLGHRLRHSFVRSVMSTINSEAGSTPVTRRWSRARVQAT
jgi:hypothetical protein